MADLFADEPWSVGELTLVIKSVLEDDPRFRAVQVTGELGNFTRHSSGHWYFALKDSQAVLSAVMFRQAAQRNGYYDFSAGDSVVATGNLSVYAPRGNYQLMVNRLEPAGKGNLYAQFEALKRKLSEAGWFDERRKRQLPLVPQRIAVITSPTGAALQDVLSTLTRRAPYLDVTLIPAVVQGEGALPTLLKAFQQVAASASPFDLVILTRGGGSLEDLWCFNEESLAEAILQCPVPVVSAIGHEVDFTIADFVADLRAPTPTAAAEQVAPSRDELLSDLAYRREQLHRLLKQATQDELLRLEELRLRGQYVVERLAEQQHHTLSRLRLQASHGLERNLYAAQRSLDLWQGRLAALDANAILQRGYAWVERAGTPIRKAAELAPDDRLAIRFADGSRTARVEG